MSNYTCRICGKQENTEKYIIKEMMFGTREEFEYFMCSDCGCLQIREFPLNMGKYYPQNYYSFKKKKPTAFTEYLKYKRDLFSYSGESLLGRFLVKLYGYPDIQTWLPELNLNKQDSILDVGTGAGELLLRLQKLGFINLSGIDQYLDEDIHYGNLTIFKKDLSEVNQTFNLVMFNHVFEHLPNPNEIFIKLKEVVKKNGYILIRIPVVDSYAWEEYKTNWVQLDAPRHFFLHTVKSIKYLADKYNFRIDNVIYDSNSFQFWGSEQYKQQIPLMSEESFFLNPQKSIFSKDKIKEYNNRAAELNKTKKGDSACFILQNWE